MPGNPSAVKKKNKQLPAALKIFVKINGRFGPSIFLNSLSQAPSETFPLSQTNRMTVSHPSLSLEFLDLCPSKGSEVKRLTQNTLPGSGGAV